jgi:hypothetical protein
MQVNGTILATTQFPNGGGSKVMYTDTLGKSSTAIPTFEELMNSGASLVA